MQFQPYARIEENEVASRRETIFYTKSLPEKITLKWKGKRPRSLINTGLYAYESDIKLKIPRVN